MRELTRFWNAVAATFPKCADVPLYWRRELGDEHAHASRFLRPNGTIASSYPCPVEHGCSCRHEVVEISDDVCAAIPDDEFRDRCDVVDVPRAEAVLHELDMNSVWAGVADALHVSMMPTPVPWREQCFQLGNLGQARPQCPVYAIVVRDPEVMVNCVLRLMLDNDGPFVVVSPTSRTYGPECDAHIRSRKGLFIALDEHVGMTPDGHWVASPASLRQIEALGRASNPEPDTRAVPENVFRLDGVTWTMSYAGETVHLPDTKGFRYISLLLAEAGRQWSVETLLAAAGNGGATIVESASSVQGADLRMGNSWGSHAGPVIDEQAKRQYRARLHEIKEEMEDADFLHDGDRLARLAKEKEILQREIFSAVGSQGKTRMAANEAEKASDAVSKAIRRATDLIGAEHPRLSRHLRDAIKRGYTLSYEPESPVLWQTN
ncbi:MAG TPA: hypothetical protein PKI11_18660 [Candidatus Hydrogenedentes bacterium]|nr:hypothetical protein [Candidatus Hydrogenedentota bacterium]HOV76223.1 hypothetical protein [Candidatus Hydrogenedentota bacterium]